ncbi:hypothetical protein Ddye_000663 [Dipteronia dyeriana]|uniref:RNase H type-1 domain-containing protein n=1 Tax=Dipteronia dyeriana TaxID=168575 RepID=A0AAD9XM52_9ROSI|nr:hypothetical protein Ddye_000663 [Dipteronia dyeriana]
MVRGPRFGVLSVNLVRCWIKKRHNGSKDLVFLGSIVEIGTLGIFTLRSLHAVAETLSEVSLMILKIGWMIKEDYATLLRIILTRKRGRKGAMSLKLDMSKAYDQVEWDFLSGMMVKLGLSDSWICQIMRCIKLQWWRLVHFLNTLAAEVLKHCYCPDTPIMQASNVSSSSFICKCFVWGKELIEAGSRWRNGDGSSVSFYHDRWPPRPVSFKVQSPPVLGFSDRVNSLKLSSGIWNEDLICASFWLDEAYLILSLPYSFSPDSDSILCHVDKLGSYKVKSGYDFGCEKHSNPSTSSLSLSESWWKALWNLQVLGKFDIGAMRWFTMPSLYVLRMWFLDLFCSLLIFVKRMLRLLGVIIRDSVDNVMASSAQSLWAGLSPQSTEAIVLLRGLLLARNSGLWPCSIESDTEVVVNLVNYKSVSCAEIGIIIQDILSLLNDFSGCIVSFVPRVANMVAHYLAKVGLSSDSDSV